jgi:hypothetical protein
MPEYLTIEEVASLLRCPKRIARLALTQATAPASYRPFVTTDGQPSGRKLYKSVEVTAWVESTRERPVVIAGSARGPQKRAA